MKIEKQSSPGATPGTTTGRIATGAKGWKTRCLLLLTGLVAAASAPSVMAAPPFITDVGKGVLPTGEIIYTIKVHLEPGQVVPWHYHVGPGWAIVLSGTLTQDEGCGVPLETFSAPQAFAEIPGKVHTAFNAGSEPVELIWTEIYPPCYDSELGFIGWIFVDGPRCEGKSGKSHLEKIQACP